MKWQQITHPQQAGPAAHVERENKGKDREHIQEQQVSWFYQGEIEKGSTPPPLLRGGMHLMHRTKKCTESSTK